MGTAAEEKELLQDFNEVFEREVLGRKKLKASGPEEALSEDVGKRILRQESLRKDICGLVASEFDRNGALLIRGGQHAVSEEVDHPVANELFALLKKKFRSVKFDKKSGVGTADLGDLQVEFSESGSDDAVRIQIKVTPFKSETAKLAFDGIVGISKAISRAT
jgi:hypothetical protein